MRVSGTDFMGSQGEAAFEWRGVHGRPPLASPRGRQGSEQVAVTAESRARRPERFPSELWAVAAVGLGLQGQRAWRPPSPHLSLSGRFTWNGPTCPRMPAPRQ